MEESSDVELPLLGGGGVRSGHERIREKVREERRRFGEMSMPEDGMTPGDVEIFETITQSLKLLPLEEVTVDDEF